MFGPVRRIVSRLPVVSSRSLSLKATTDSFGMHGRSTLALIVAERRSLLGNASMRVAMRFMCSSKSNEAEKNPHGNEAVTAVEEGAEEGAEEGEKEATTEGDDLTSKISALEAEIKELKEKVIRSYAEEENVRRIAKRDIENARTYANVSFAKSLLDVADNLDLTLDAAKAGESKGGDVDYAASFKTLVEGVEMTNAGLLKTFGQQGIEKYGDVGEVFDPNIHDAIFNMPDASKDEGSIGQVIKKGYRMKERVIRAAQVGTVIHP